VRNDAIEAFLFEEIGRSLGRFTADKQGRKMLADAVRTAYGGFDADRAKKERRQLEDRQWDVEQKIERLIENATPTTREFVDKRVSELKRELDEVAARLQELDAAADRAVDIEVLIPEVLDCMERFDEVVAEGTVDEKRRFLRAFIRRVELNPDTGRGHAELYCLPTKTASPTGADNAANSSLIMVAGARSAPVEMIAWLKVEFTFDRGGVTGLSAKRSRYPTARASPGGLRPTVEVANPPVLR